MKRLIKLALVIAMVATSTSLYAQKYARINSQELIVVMPEFKQMQTDLEAFSKELGEQLEQIQVEFNNKYADFQKTQETMNSSTKQMKQMELEQLQQRYQEYSRIANEDLQRKQADLLSPIQKKASDAISEVAKAKGYIAVFDMSVPSLAYFDANQMPDIQAEVRTKLGIAVDAKPEGAPAN